MAELCAINLPSLIPSPHTECLCLHDVDAEEEKRLNATYIISVARKLGCSVFLLPEDIMEVIASSLLQMMNNYLI